MAPMQTWLLPQVRVRVGEIDIVGYVQDGFIPCKGYFNCFCSKHETSCTLVF